MESDCFRDQARAAIDRILDSREKYTPLEWGVALFYYKCGLSQREIARIFVCSQGSVASYLRRIRRKALS
jgi:DNA-directed RNA polymerase specialized sigma24 family protein